MLRAYRADLAGYVFFAVFALVTALYASYAPHRVWGCYAAAAYALGAAVLIVSRKRWAAVGVAVVVGILAPLTHLVIARGGGHGDWSSAPASWTAQPEVWVIERSARLLLDTGSPYLDVTALGRPPAVDDYTPYGPVMSWFGLPRALLDAPLADVRVVFAVCAVGCVVGAWWLIGRPPVPVNAVHLAVLSPTTALTVAVAGPDCAVLGLLLLALALAVQRRGAASGVVLALAVGAKFTAAPAVLVLVMLLPNAAGRLRFAAAFTAATAVVTAGVVWSNPRAFVENALAFPVGAGLVDSPAASPLPGHLLASTGPAGHATALALLGIAALIIAAWVVLRPPADGADAALRLAVGLGVATMLSPATRWGYVIYPLILLGARLLLLARRRSAATA